MTKKVRKSGKLIYGWGINDVNYSITKSETINGKNTKVWVCPYYSKWSGMIERCFDIKYQEKKPTYRDCTICEEWKYLSNFIKWVDSQPNKDWVNCEPDKDILFQGNKHYSPETVVFVSRQINNFLTDSGKIRGAHMIGVSYIPQGSEKNPYRSECNNPFKRKGRYLGIYPTELEAHLAWQAKKHEYACALADLQDDPRVAQALRERYAPDKDWTNK